MRALSVGLEQQIPVEKENDILEAALDEADGWSGFRIGRSGIWGSPDLVDGEPGGSFE